MMTTDAPFRELKGIGPATEGKLHASGIRTWAALAETLDAIAQVTGVDAKRLRSLRDESRQKHDDSSVMTVGDGERTSRFVLSIVTHADGQVARSSVVDVRSELTKSFPGVSGADIVAFIEERIGEPVVPAAVEARPASSAPLGFAEATGFDPAEPIRFRASSAQNDLVVIDAGKAIGGAGNDVLLRWDTSEIDTGDSAGFRYRASLAWRAYGGSGGSGWRPLGVTAGSAQPGEIVELAFEATGLAPGINRLELTVEVQPMVDISATRRRVEAPMASVG